MTGGFQAGSRNSEAPQVVFEFGGTIMTNRIRLMRAEEQ